MTQLIAPKVFLHSTNEGALKYVKLEDLKKCALDLDRIKNKTLKNILIRIFIKLQKIRTKKVNIGRRDMDLKNLLQNYQKWFKT